MAAGVIYWVGWRILLPKVFGYELVPRKETLSDGTVITLVSTSWCSVKLILRTHLFVVLAQEDPVKGSLVLGCMRMYIAICVSYINLRMELLFETLMLHGVACTEVEYW